MLSVGIVAVTLLAPQSELKTYDLLTYAQMISERTKTPALLSAPDMIQVKADARQSDIDTFLEPARRIGFTFLRSDVAAGGQSGIPISKQGVLATYSEGRSGGYSAATIPADFVKNGLVSFEPKTPQFLSIQAISTKLSKPIAPAAYFVTGANEFPIAFYGKDVKESDFMRALAKAVGGKYKIAPKEHILAFDPIYFRTEAVKLVGRAVSRIDLDLKNPGAGMGMMTGVPPQQRPVSEDKDLTKQAMFLLSTTLNHMAPELIEQTFAYPGTTTRLNLNVYKGLQNSVANYLRAAGAKANPPSQNGTQVNRQNRASAAVTGLLARIDTRNPGHLIITTDFRLSLELNTTNSRNHTQIHLL
jgi:hypothetical protein